MYKTILNSSKLPCIITFKNSFSKIQLLNKQQKLSFKMGKIIKTKISLKILYKYLSRIKTSLYLHPLTVRAHSSVGSEHLVYTQGVGGSNPSAPTENPKAKALGFFYL